eukprot:1834075-Pleurochrysis_carterae.AAC.1
MYRWSAVVQSATPVQSVKSPPRALENETPIPKESCCSESVATSKSGKVSGSSSAPRSRSLS